MLGKEKGVGKGRRRRKLLERGKGGRKGWGRS